MDKDIYQELIIELYQNPLNFGEIRNPDAKAEVYNATCGDRIVIYVKIKDGKIADVKFTGAGCAISQASASLFTDVIKGMEVVRNIGHVATGPMDRPVEEVVINTITIRR